MKRISIETSRPVLDITSTRAKLSIETKIRKFNSQNTPPVMRSNPKGATFKIDWGKIRSESGLRTPERQMQMQKAQDRQLVQEAISRTVSNGDYVLQLENYMGSKSDPLAQTVVNNMESDLPEINVTSMPQSSPVGAEWDVGGVNIEWEQGNLKVDWQNDYMPNITVTPHSVEIRLKGEMAVKISVNEDNLAPVVGRQLNKVI